MYTMMKVSSDVEIEFSALKTILMSLLTSQSNASPLVKVLSLGL